MCLEFNKPNKGVFLSITCKCGKYCIRKSKDNNYEPLIKSGNVWSGLGFNSAEDAINHIKGLAK